MTDTIESLRAARLISEARAYEEANDRGECQDLNRPHALMRALWRACESLRAELAAEKERRERAEADTKRAWEKFDEAMTSRAKMMDGWQKAEARLALDAPLAAAARAYAAWEHEQTEEEGEDKGEGDRLLDAMLALARGQVKK